MAGEPHGYIPGLGYNLPYPVWGPWGGSVSNIGGESQSTIKGGFGGGGGSGGAEGTLFTGGEGPVDALIHQSNKMKTQPAGGSRTYDS